MIKKKQVYYLILVIAVLLAVLPWLRQGIATTDDFRGHLPQLYHLKNSLSEGKLPVFMMYELYSGYPVFYFYSTLSYFLSIPFVLFVNVVTALKFSIILSFFVAAFSMYAASMLLFHDDDAALISSVAYTFFTYHFINAGVRGSFNELWGYSFFPLAVAFLILSVDSPSKKNYFFAVILSAAMILIHMPSAYMLFLTFGIFLVYKLFQGEIKVIRTAILLFFVVFLLVSFWLVPFLVDSKYANFSHETTRGGFVFFGTILSSDSVIGVKELVGRNFGDFPLGTLPFYIGIVLMLLFLVGFFHKTKYVGLFMFITAFFIAVNATTFLVKIIPLAILVHFKFRFFMIIGAMLCLIAGVNAKSIINLITDKLISEQRFVARKRIEKKPDYAPFLVLAFCVIIIVDFYPANNFHWLSQKDEYFINRPLNVEVMKSISQEEGYFLVFSPQVQGAYLYHGKFELGYDWEGYREGVIKEIQDTYTTVGFDFWDGLKNKDVFRINNASASLGYFGVKYVVLNCIDGFERFYPLKYSNAEYCVYYNPYYRPIIEVENGASDVLFGFGRISFNTAAENDVFAVVKIANFKGHYKAYVDGKETKIEDTWPKYMKLYIPKGAHSVSIVYKDTLIQIITKVVSALTFLVLIIYSFRITGSSRIHKKQGNKLLAKTKTKIFRLRRRKMRVSIKQKMRKRKLKQSRPHTK